MGTTLFRSWGAAALAAGIALGGGVLAWKHFGPDISQRMSIGKQSAAPPSKKSSIGDLHAKVITNGVKKPVNTGKSASIAQALYNDPEGVTTTITGQWITEYSAGKLRPSLDIAMRRSHPHLASIKHLFLQEGIPTELAFLAIPESHWNPKANSKYARGLYQFTPGTGKARGAIIAPGYDSRYHPLESGKMAAVELKDLHRRMNRDWLLALAGYNSGMPNEYLKTAKTIGNGEVSYTNYLLFLGEKAEREAEKAAKDALKLPSQVALPKKKNMAVEEILAFLKVPKSAENKSLFQSANGSKPLYQKGQRVHVPLKLREQKVKRTKREDYIKENLEYPPKFLAVTHILEQKHPDYYHTAPSPHSYVVHTLPDDMYKTHIVKKGDTLSKLARSYHVPPSTISSANKLVKGRISLGQKLNIPSSITLPSLAREHHAPLEAVAADNPHIFTVKGAYQPLPPKARVYFRQSYGPK